MFYVSVRFYIDCYGCPAHILSKWWLVSHFRFIRIYRTRPRPPFEIYRHWHWTQSDCKPINLTSIGISCLFLESIVYYYLFFFREFSSFLWWMRGFYGEGSARHGVGSGRANQGSRLNVVIRCRQTIALWHPFPPHPNLSVITEINAFTSSWQQTTKMKRID